MRQSSLVVRQNKSVYSKTDKIEWRSKNYLGVHSHPSSKKLDVPRRRGRGRDDAEIWIKLQFRGDRQILVDPAAMGSDPEYNLYLVVRSDCSVNCATITIQTLSRMPWHQFSSAMTTKLWKTNSKKYQTKINWWKLCFSFFPRIADFWGKNPSFIFSNVILWALAFFSVFILYTWTKNIFPSLGFERRPTR